MCATLNVLLQFYDSPEAMLAAIIIPLACEGVSRTSKSFVDKAPMTFISIGIIARFVLTITTSTSFFQKPDIRRNELNVLEKFSPFY